MLRAALFDLDGTLFDTEKVYTQFWGAVGREFHPEIESFAQRVKGITLKQIYQDYFQNPNQIATIQTRLERFEKEMEYRFVPFAIEFIQDLRVHGVKCAVVTSSDRKKMDSVRQKMPEFDAYFDLVLTSEDFAASKPDPDCYIRAAEMLSVEWDECIIFEDAATGLEAGRKSSMMTVGVVGTLDEDSIRDYCDVWISSFAVATYDWAKKLLTDRLYISKEEQSVLAYLQNQGISYEVYRHPEGKTIETAQRWWRKDGSLHCKNIFLRNHRGNQHYLFCFPSSENLQIHTLEQRLKTELMSQGSNCPGKLSFASKERMQKYLGLQPGSVSPFGLINDKDNHVILFLDEHLRNAESLSFHPNDCRSTVVIKQDAFSKFLNGVGNVFRYLPLVGDEYKTDVDDRLR